MEAVWHLTAGEAVVVVAPGANEHQCRASLFLI
jgi:hypothetical protein